MPGAPPLGGPPPGGAPAPGAPPNIGAATPAQGTMGNAAAAMASIQNAVKMLETALPQIPMGSPMHTEILNATKGILKHMNQGGGNPGLELQSLLQMARQASQSGPLSALQRMQPEAGAPPAMPQMAA